MNTKQKENNMNDLGLKEPTREATVPRIETREVCETSLARLDDHEWQILSNTWSRGVDWYVQKVGKKWTPIDIFGQFPLFKTKREAEKAATTLLLWESSNRAIKRCATSTLNN